jgi:chromosome segregation ATPase
MKKITQDMTDAFEEYERNYRYARGSAEDAQYAWNNMDNSIVHSVDECEDLDINDMDASDIESAIRSLTEKRDEIESEKDEAESYASSLETVRDELDGAIEALNSLFDAYNAQPQIKVGDIVKVEKHNFQTYRVIHIHGEWALGVPLMDPHFHSEPIVATCEDLFFVESADEAA